MNYIWKEWLDQTRGKGLWLGLLMIVVLSVFLFVEARSFPGVLGFEVYLLSLYEMNLYLLPLLSLFLASFAVMNEKELRTLMILMTKKESYRSFMFKKSMAVHIVTLGLFISWYFILAVPMKIWLTFELSAFLYFILTTTIFILIFNQIGLFMGSICKSRMQLIGANIFIWFFFIFILDLIFLYMLPSITYDNVDVFSYFFFMDPLNSLRFFMEASLGLISLDNMSRIMEKLVFMAPWKIVIINLVFWVVLSFELSIWLRSKGERA